MTKRTFFLSTCAIVALGFGWANHAGWLHLGKAVDAASAQTLPKDISIPVVTARATQEDFPIVRQAIGFVESPASVVVRSRIDSQIVQQHIKDGQFVKAGDLLFTLDDGEQQAQIIHDTANLTRDQATQARIQGDLARAVHLLQSNAGTQQALDQAQTDEKTGLATIAADQAALKTDQLKLTYTKITAPIDGRVGAVQVTPGNLVTASGGQGLVTITQVKPIRVSFAMPERDIGLIKSALEKQTEGAVSVTPQGASKAILSGSLNFVDSSVDIASGTIGVKASFANDDLALWPGQYVNVSLTAGALPAAIVVPTVSVQQGQKGTFIYVVNADNSVDVRQVVVAMTNGDKTAITSGISVGEKVVTDGQMRLKKGVKVRDDASAKAVKAPAPAEKLAEEIAPTNAGAKP